MSRRINLLIIFSLLFGVMTQELYKKVTHNIDTEAKCLDGSPPALYVHSGSEP
jgi:hypothetical protein